MSFRRSSIALAVLLGACSWLSVNTHRTAAVPAPEEQGSTSPPTAPGVIKTEAALVLVDAIVTDKKGNYIQDIQVNEFHVFEDEQEQPITSFSKVADVRGPDGKPQPRYLTLFFDNGTMNAGDQSRARQAAAEFIEKSVHNERMVAVVDFTGVTHVAQNFTSDLEALKRAVGGIKYSSLQANEGRPLSQVASMGAPSMVQVRTDFAARSTLLAIRSLAKTLRPVPGRKTLILFSGGFPLNPERESELAATIDAANKANVAIYPVDVRGLQGLNPMTSPSGLETPGGGYPGLPPGARRDGSDFPHLDELLATPLDVPLFLATLAAAPQTAGGGSQAGGGTSGGSRGGSTGTSTGATGGGASAGRSPTGTTGLGTGSSRGSFGRRDPFDPYSTDPFSRDGSRLPSRSIIPPLMDSAGTNQQILYALANGTGGFPILNTNDFAEGLIKISREVDEYYILGYAPPRQVHDGSYHKIQVKVDRKGAKVRARNGYYDAKSPDLLAGRPEGKVLEERAASPEPGDIPVSLAAPHFYTSAEVARVNLVMQIPASTLAFEKEKGKFQTSFNVLGIAYREDGSVAARFSDTVKLDMEKKELKEFAKGDYTYQNNFNIAPGKYTLKVVLGAGGQKYGKYETLLTVAPFDGKKFEMSAVALSNRMQKVSELTLTLDAALREERTPLVVGGIEMVPSANLRFKRDEQVGLYVEVYEPLMLNPRPPRVGIIYDVIDRKTQQQVYTSNTVLVNQFAQPGNPIIPVGLMLPIEKLQAGEYKLQVRARDEVGNASSLFTTEFYLD
jgi:VWFA-related protein